MTDITASDELGPVDYITDELLSFSRKFNGHIGPALAASAERGLVGVLDPLTPKNGDGGSLKAFQLTDLDDSEPGALRIPGGSTCPHHTT